MENLAALNRSVSQNDENPTDWSKLILEVSWRVATAVITLPGLAIPGH